MKYSRPVAIIVALYFGVVMVTAQPFNNITALTGTWATHRGQVVTGSLFADPVNNIFHYPPVTGISFSFTDTGHFEEARFRVNPNATDPHCITAVVLWQHGTYALNSNGSITTDSNPFRNDGRVQVQDACAPITSVLTYYNQPGLYRNWVISEWRGKFMLQLEAFDGALMPRMYLVTPDPSAYMYPTQALVNNTNNLNPAYSS